MFVVFIGMIVGPVAYSMAVKDPAFLKTLADNPLKNTFNLVQPNNLNNNNTNGTTDTGFAKTGPAKTAEASSTK
jgi:hypothetical protein